MSGRTNAELRVELLTLEARLRMLTAAPAIKLLASPLIASLTLILQELIDRTEAHHGDKS